MQKEQTSMQEELSSNARGIKQTKKNSIYKPQKITKLKLQNIIKI
jgi:hypothetical protein